MRNIFDQYSQPENRVSHALLSALNEDRALLGRFLRQLVKIKPPTDPKSLQVLEQQYPGEMELREDEAERRGIPDGWIFDDEGWCVFIESKVLIGLTQGQVERHRRMAERMGFSGITAVAIVAYHPLQPPANTTILEWRTVYSWLRSQGNFSDWAYWAAEYLVIAETILTMSGQLKKGALTMFSGFHFDEKHPFNYLQAKLYLKNAMSELRERADLMKDISVKPKSEGRGAITGAGGDHVWDYLSLVGRSKGEASNRHIHLTLGVGRQGVSVAVIVPDKLNTAIRHRIIKLKKEGFQKLIAQIVTNMRPLLKSNIAARPFFLGLQRRWPSRKAKPFSDAVLEFDLRTAIPESGSPKLQPNWLDAGYGSFSNKNGSNYEFQVGVNFPYDRCHNLQSREALDLIAKAWIACKPLTDLATR